MSDQKDAAPKSATGAYRRSAIDADGLTLPADEAAFASWRRTFIFVALALAAFAADFFVTLDIGHVKLELLAEGASDSDVENLTYGSPLYLRTILKRLFSLSCTVGFVGLLGLRLCGVYPVLNFYLIFAPLFLSIALFPLLEALRLLCCWRGAEPIVRCCAFVLSVCSIYVSIFTFLLTAEKLERTYNPASTFSSLSLFSLLFETGPNNDGWWGAAHPPPSAMLCMALVIGSLSIVSALLTMTICVLWSGSVDLLGAASAAAAHEGGNGGGGGQRWASDEPPASARTHLYGADECSGQRSYGAV